MTTLFLFAGCSGSGKTTLLRSAYRHKLHLFGDHFHTQFLDTNRNLLDKEFKSYKRALKKMTYFHTVHIPSLREESLLPRNILIHIDLKNVLRKLCILKVEGLPGANSFVERRNLF